MNDVQKIISEATIDGNTVKLICGQINRELYVRVDEVLKRLWGKWNGRKKVHEFGFDPTELIRNYLETGNMPPKNEIAYFPTPEIILDDIRTMIDYGQKFLEPSAGQGAIVEAILKEFPEAEVDCVEYLKINAEILKKKGYNTKHMDFLEVQPKEIYDYVVMNPPFSVPGDKKAFMTHLYHAMKFLKSYGKTICIMPTGWLWQTDKQTLEFKDFVSSHNGSIQKYETGTFKDAGTMIKTCMVVLNSEEISVERFVEIFDMVSNGSYGQELWRNSHKNKSDEEYVEFVINEIWKTCPCDAIPKKYMKEYLEYLKTMEF